MKRYQQVVVVTSPFNHIANTAHMTVHTQWAEGGGRREPVSIPGGPVSPRLPGGPGGPGGPTLPWLPVRPTDPGAPCTPVGPYHGSKGE